jgi:hypothetical protein
METNKYSYPIIIFCILVLMSSCITNDQEIPFNDQIKQINDRLTFAEIKPTSNLHIGTRGSGNIYEISIREGQIKDQYFFNEKKYIIIKGGEKLSGVSGNEICTIIDSIDNAADDKVLDVIKRLKLGAEISAGPAKFNIDGIEGLIEMAYAAYSASQIDSVNIYIKGFADGYFGDDWLAPLDTVQEYRFNNIEYLPSTEKSSYNPVHYSATPGQYLIKGNLYHNKDLPNLRAQFIKKDMILPMCEACPKKIRSVQILEGFEFPKGTHDPTERKVQIFIEQIKKE